MLPGRRPLKIRPPRTGDRVARTVASIYGVSIVSVPFVVAKEPMRALAFNELAEAAYPSTTNQLPVSKSLTSGRSFQQVWPSSDSV